MEMIPSVQNPVRHPDENQRLTDGAEDVLWSRLRQEAQQAYDRAPQLAGLFLDCILEQPFFEAAVFYRIAMRLKNDVVDAEALVNTARRAMLAEPSIHAAVRADIMAVLERDPATERLIEPFLYFKGFHAIQTQRLAHWLWRNDERDFALYLQSRSSDVFQTDIHPAVPFGRGIFLDHATGLVVGETAEVDDDVSLLQNVTLGGTGKDAGDRHPKVRQGVIIGAGAKILGNIEIGAFARIAAGSVVLHSVAPYSTVAGVPAKVIKKSTGAEPPRRIDEVLNDFSNGYLDYSI
jgi:serine O-acetyltransferase